MNSQSFFESRLLNNIKASYISNQTFFENKHGFSEKNLKSEPIPTLILKKNKNLHIPQSFYQNLVHNLTHENTCKFNLQTRGFKTDRSIKAEVQRNPTLASRVKAAFGFHATDPLESKVTSNATSNSERMKNILGSDDPTITENEKQRIKIAFAEGYLLGNTNPRTGKATKYFRLVQQILTAIIFMAIIMSLMATTNGSIFR